MYHKLEKLSLYDAGDVLADDRHKSHPDLLNAFVALGGDIDEIYFYSDYNNAAFPTEFYDPSQDDEKPDFAEWQDFCSEWNRDVIVDKILDKIGVTLDWNLKYKADRKCVVRIPAQNAVNGMPWVWFVENDDPEDRSGDYSYEEATAGEIADGAIRVTLSDKSTAREIKIAQDILLGLDRL